VRIAIASGKGGTGKTTVAVNLYYFIGAGGSRVVYADGDVEEPNGHLYLRPVIEDRQEVTVSVPEIDMSNCTACGECVRFCRYNALVRLGKEVLVYPELCHGCGGCALVCPQGAISDSERCIGTFAYGTSGTGKFMEGRLNIGEAMSPPVIRKVAQPKDDDEILVIDAPPGTSCPVIAAIRNTDYVVLVTEPTPFGLNDLALALAMVRELKLSHGVVINRAETGNNDAEQFCKKEGVSVLTKIPDDRRIALACSRGELVVETVPGIKECFHDLWASIRRLGEK
jgi:MinD superfamily P-loop ATPase